MIRTSLVSTVVSRGTPRGRFWNVALILGLCLGAPASAFEEGAYNASDVTAVEEDWEIEIGDPSAEDISPQIFVVTSPSGDLKSRHSVFEINNLLLPDFYGGGLQFQTWVGDSNTGEKHHDNFAALATRGEVVKFTVRMSLSDGALSFEVKDGESTTWGDFGGGSLKLTHESDLSDLSSYRTVNSMRHSRVGFGGNRVNKLHIKQVRFFKHSDLLHTDSTGFDVLNWQKEQAEAAAEAEAAEEGADIGAQ